MKSKKMTKSEFEKMEREYFEDEYDFGGCPIGKEECVEELVRISLEKNKGLYIDDSEADDSDQTAPCNHEVVYYGVAFHNSTKLYSYRSDDQTLAVGDGVIVPVGPDDEEQEGVIRKIEMCHPSCTPFPYEEMKRIIRRSMDREHESMQSSKSEMDYQGWMAVLETAINVMLEQIYDEADPIEARINALQTLSAIIGTAEALGLDLADFGLDKHVENIRRQY